MLIVVGLAMTVAVYGVVGLIVVFIAAVLYTVVPSMVGSSTGAGCV